MTNEELLREMSNLSERARRQIERYISYLRKTEEAESEKPTKSFREEGFFGMWADREDMRDSSAWVRKIRKEHWNRNR